MAGLIAVAYFLCTLFFSLAIFLLWARLGLRYLRVSPLQPIHRVILTLTQPIVGPLERLFYQDKKIFSRYDWVALALLILVEIIKIIIFSLLLLNTWLPLSYLVLYVIADLVLQPTRFLFYLIIIRLLLSWLTPHTQHPLVDVIVRITNPILRLGRRIIPDISGFDFSPMIMLIILMVIMLFITASLPFKII